MRRAVLLSGAVALTLGAGGCWYAALELAPLGLQAAETVGSGALNLAASTANAAHHDKSADDSDNHIEAEMDRKDRCEELQLGGPGVIELRGGNPAATQYRELRADISPDKTQWAPIISDETDPAGWRPTVNLARMDFKPPITSTVPETGNIYLAYVSAQPESSADLEGLGAFGNMVGTFGWDGRVYEYAVFHQLPCFPPPVPVPKP